MKNNLTPEDCKKVEAFLAKIRPMIKTGDVRIEQTEKNILFDKKYNMRHAEKLKVIELLTAEDCTKIELNDNPRYPLVDVHFFLKDVHTMTYYGEPVQPCVYIKLYAQECSTYDEVVTISFHEEGMYDQ